MALTMTCEPSREKTNILGFRQNPTQTGMYSHRSRLEIIDLRIRGIVLSMFFVVIVVFRSTNSTICLTTKINSLICTLFLPVHDVGFLVQRLLQYTFASVISISLQFSKICTSQN